jgi:hypothetical protein
MLKFNLDDLTVEGLRKLGDHYGIPKAVTQREALLTALNERMSSKAEIGLGVGASPWYKTPPILVSIISVIIAVTATAYAIAKDFDQKSKDRIQHWQQVVIYKIIEDGTKSGDRAIGFEDIRKQYVTEASASEGGDIPKGELQPWALRRVLLDLITTQAVYQTLDDRYAIQRSSTNPRADRASVEEKAKYEILNILSREGGKYDYSQLAQHVTDTLKMTNEEFNTLMTQMMAANMVLIGTNKKLYSIASIPRATK